MLDLWYKNAIIYCLDVGTFMDSNGDGIGDFPGLTDRLDHLEALGATVVWLNPFYPTPNRDNGYDITDFYAVDPRLGNLGDFVDFTRAARDRGIRVLIDLVVNHTSIEHPWFKDACSSKDSPFRDWFVWSDKKPRDITKGVIFPGVQEAVWTRSEPTGAWYMHRFYEFEADLNIANPAVREQIQLIMGFWLELGVAGFRIDAVPFLVEYEGLNEEPDRDPLLLLSEMRDFMSWRRSEAIMLAEANVTRDKIPAYFGGRGFDADERMHMIFDFPLNQQLYLALARGSAAPIVEALASRPANPPVQAQWANFLRNHDELSLDRLSKRERQEVMDAFGPDPESHIYGRGLRRRLAPMLGGELARLGLMHALLFALPGTPVMWYGDEIGMGDDLTQPERNAVRTPMQWANARHGGFSATDGELIRPVIEGGRFGYPTVNVAAGRDRPDTLFGLVQRMIRARRACPEIGWGETRVLGCSEGAVLALEHAWRGQRSATLHNLSPDPVRLTLEIDADCLTPILGDGGDAAPAREPIELGPHGYRWFRVDGERR